MTLCKKHTIALFVIAVVLLSGCRQELELAGHNYYYTIKEKGDVRFQIVNSYLLENDQVETLNNAQTTTYIIDTLGNDSVTKIQKSYINDGLILSNNHYYTGARATVLYYRDYSEGKNKQEITETIPFVEINGTRKHFNLPGSSEGILILNEGEDVYFIIQSIIKATEFTTLMYYVSVNGEEPTLIAETHQEIYSLRNAEIKKCKKFGDKFYFVGTKDDVAFFCEASQIKTPFYLSDYGGCAYDFVMKDSTIYECGKNQGKAFLWKGQEPYELPVPAGTKESEARCMVMVGEDMYIGGRIDEEPAIWKNGELLATYTEFPPVWTGYYILGGQDEYYTDYKPVTEEFGWVCAMEIEDNTIYSIVETSNYAQDHKRFALEWYFDDNRVTFDFKYDLVEMLRNGTLVLEDSYYGLSENGHTAWQRTNFGTPHIIPYYVKTKAKRKK
ncbi:MAG: hypothetical protein MJZ96_06340 [Paludibacteraceae bacterium]|nr:hypothetical protein [Paludibacteraceae bacterium]